MEIKDRRTSGEVWEERRRGGERMERESGEGWEGRCVESADGGRHECAV